MTPAEWQRVNKEKHNIAQRRRRLKNPIQYMLYAAKQRANRKGIPFDITDEDVTKVTHCPVTGVELVYCTKREKGTFFQVPNAATLDRIDSNKGYVKGNVRIISWRMNNIKADATLKELKQLVSYVENNK